MADPRLTHYASFLHQISTDIPKMALSNEKVQTVRELVDSVMTSDQIDEAERMPRERMAKYQQ